MTRQGPSRAESRLRPPQPTWAAPPEPDAAAVARLRAELKLPELVCAVLVSRGLSDPDAAKSFLRPQLDQLADPALLADAQRATTRLAEAVRSSETIFVHGDYDVDGICATALLTRWLRRLGGQVVPFVPHRLRDGYDFTEAGLSAAKEAGATLVVTADCGTVAHETIEQANQAGIDVIVTDHHKVAGPLPPAHAVLNPNRPDCDYPDARLCGAGLAYKLAELVGRELGADLDELVEYLDLVALATVADLVPLAGENRILVHYGLRRFAATRVVGVSALLAVAGVEPSEVDAGKIGFVVAPRINAAGRMGESADALRLLLTDDRAEADRLATALDDINRVRREEDQRTLDEAVALLEERYDPERDFGVVLAAEGWHPGVIGIVASRVVELVHRPVVLLALDGARGRGSARSIPGFHLYEAIAECSEHLGRFGGHEQAAGMDIAAADVDTFAEAFNEAARSRLGPELLRPRRRPDVSLDLAEAELQTLHWLGYLGPHGIGNPRPLLCTRDVRLEGPRVVGENHLKVRLAQGGARLDAIGFGLADRHAPEALGDGPYEVLFKLDRNEYRGRVSAQAVLNDLRPQDAP